MEFEFKRDVLYKTIRCQFSMGHEAMGTWLEQELTSDLAGIARLFEQIQLLQQQQLEQFELLGSEFSLFLNKDEAKVIANVLLSEQGELPEDLHYYDEESIALAGLEDFEQMLRSYERFIREGC